MSTISEGRAGGFHQSSTLVNDKEGENSLSFLANNKCFHRLHSVIRGLLLLFLPSPSFYLSSSSCSSPHCSPPPRAPVIPRSSPSSSFSRHNNGTNLVAMHTPTLITTGYPYPHLFLYTPWVSRPKNHNVYFYTSWISISY